MKNKYKILDRGNFYFPFIDKGKEFIVEDGIEITLEKKDTRMVKEFFKYKNNLFLGILAEAIWDALKKLNLEEYKDCWLVPIHLYKLGKDYICSIDILKKVNKKMKIDRKLKNEKIR